jgi:exonuclease VII small subunit
MKKILLSSIVLTVLLSGIASAQTASTAVSRINEIKQTITNIKQKAAEEKAQIKAQIASTTADIKNAKQELKDAIEIKIGKKLDAQKIKIANEFENTIKQLQSLVTRIESRIAKMDASGINTTTAKALLETAKTKITLANTEVTNLENVLAQQIPASTSTSSISQRVIILKSIKTQSEKTKAAIKVARKAVIDVVNSLKPGLQKTKNSTSTESTSTNN